MQPAPRIKELRDRGYRIDTVRVIEYTLCNLAPTPRRKPPITKQNVLPNDRTSPEPTTVLAKQLTGTTTVPKTALLDPFTGTTTENNVFMRVVLGVAHSIASHYNKQS